MLIIALDDGVQRSVELALGVEESQLDDEEVLEDVAPELLHQLSCSCGGTT